MKTPHYALALAAVFAFSQMPVSAQWDPYPLAGIPRTPDGEPDLAGPTPRTTDGKPDLSGIWEVVRHNQSGEQGRPVGEPETPPPGAPPYATFWELEHGFKDGLPMTPWARALKEERLANESRDNPDAHCLPMGHMQFHNHIQPRKIIQTPDVTVLLNEGNAGIRQIYTDGRSLPDNDPIQWWYGYSVGSWEGDTLVVETIGFRDDVWLDYNGTPLTGEGKITERFQRINYGTILLDVTIDDPKAYTEPFSVRVEWRIMSDTSLIEFVCLENEQSTQYFDPQ
jgi:hypothetical protein